MSYERTNMAYDTSDGDTSFEADESPVRSDFDENGTADEAAKANK